MNTTTLENNIYTTLAKPLLRPEIVIHACDTLSQRIAAGYYQTLINDLEMNHLVQGKMLKEAVMMLSESYLNNKLNIELGKDANNLFPLGILFHIGARNVDGLSAYSVIEGLLTGNINLIKLPSNDIGISALILQELLEIEPLLREYVYLFFFFSAEKCKMKELANLADAIVIWGGDRTIRSIRDLAPTNCKIIEWGHKVSFAYLVQEQLTDEALFQLAEHIIETKQLLCSSCQGIYIDSDNEKDILSFCERFIKILDLSAQKHPDYDMGWIAQNTLKSYTYKLHHEAQDYLEFSGTGIRIFYKRDAVLESALQYGNIWVKSLPRNEIIKTLKKHHGHLQTVGLLCSDSKEEFSSLFLKAGVTRIRNAKDMSSVYVGEAHDGEHPLRRYSKVCEGLHFTMNNDTM